MDGVRYTPPKGDVLGRVFINAKRSTSRALTRRRGSSPSAATVRLRSGLKDRKNRELSYDDIIHYRRICGALAETPRVMAASIPLLNRMGDGR